VGCALDAGPVGYVGIAIPALRKGLVFLLDARQAGRAFVAGKRSGLFLRG
jgi:hypothetical protein